MALTAVCPVLCVFKRVLSVGSDFYFEYVVVFNMSPILSIET